MDHIFTSRYTMDTWREAFEGKGHDDIKVTVEFDSEFSRKT